MQSSKAGCVTQTAPNAVSRIHQSSSMSCVSSVPHKQQPNARLAAVYQQSMRFVSSMIALFVVQVVEPLLGCVMSAMPHCQAGRLLAEFSLPQRLQLMPLTTDS
jgi:hypothetical protein